MKHKLIRNLPIAIILLVAALLRFHQLTRQSLWSDEGNSVALARRGFVEIARRTAFDIHPPLYYWLLKLWTAVFGESELALRSLSVILGIGLVYLIWQLGRRLFGPRAALIAAFLAALSPLQIYYAQEARMYMLLAFLSALTVLLAILVLDNSGPGSMSLISLSYIVTVTAGLYTHYAYPVILIVVNLVALIWLWNDRGGRAGRGSPALKERSSGAGGPSQSSGRRSSLAGWLALQLIPLLLYLPWLPIAVRQITTWPSERQADTLSGPIEQSVITLLAGLSWPYGSLAVEVLALTIMASLWFGLRGAGFRFRERGWFALLLLWLWLLLPLMLTLLIFSPAFLKFLLAASPPLTLLLAFVTWQLAALFERKWLGYLAGGAAMAALLTVSGLSLFHYYTNPDFARDNYRGIAQFIQAVAGPEDAIILNAEGQQDVFSYYYDRGDLTTEAPVHPLPKRRPLDEVETLNELQDIVDNANNIYVVYWAARQADPDGLIEGWLDSHLFKATDQWYGNVRLVSYASPQDSSGPATIPLDYRLGNDIRLQGYAIAAPRAEAGDILQVALHWQTTTPLGQDYTVFLQLLDQNNHLVGQRDARPITATSSWPAGPTVIDTHGIFIEPGTPPGPHRLIVGLYDTHTGQRLVVTSGEELAEAEPGNSIDLGSVEVVASARPLPAEAFDIQVPVNVQLEDLILLGYDMYKLGYRSSPEEALQPGDPIQLVIYWVRPQPGPAQESQLSIRVVTSGGQDTALATLRPLAGIDYPVGAWQAGEIVRAQYTFFLSGLEPGSYRLALSVVDSEASSASETVLTRPFRVEGLAGP